MLNDHSRATKTLPRPFFLATKFPRPIFPATIFPSTGNNTGLNAVGYKQVSNASNYYNLSNTVSY